MCDVVFEDERIRLRRGKKEDAKELYNLLLDPEVMLYFGESETTYDYALSEIEWFNKLFEENSCRWVIADKNTDQYIGDIGVFNYAANDRKGEIGFILNKSYWGKGIMSSCVQAVLNYAFVELNYNRVEALVDPRNQGCLALLNKSGFSKEGLLRDYEFEHGGFVDLEIHSILQREFKIKI